MIYLVAFTTNGKELAKRIEETLEDEVLIKPEETSLHDWADEAFREQIPLVFVGATGIAVRTIAPLMMGKLLDIPVLVIDEKGSFVIPLLSGHVGGANELAIELAEKISAIPVITTATDLNDAFSVDLFAKEEHLTICNKDGIRKVSSKALEGKPITLSVKDYPPTDLVDVLISDEITMEDQMHSLIQLKRKPYVLGIGCKKGKSDAEIKELVLEVLEEIGAEISDIYCIGTIDLKENEPGLCAFARKNRIPLISFTGEMLAKAPGDYTASSFVKDTVGVDNVCERSAMLACGCKGSFLVRKRAKNGVTLAVVKRL